MSALECCSVQSMGFLEGPWEATVEVCVLRSPARPFVPILPGAGARRAVPEGDPVVQGWGLLSLEPGGRVLGVGGSGRYRWAAGGRAWSMGQSWGTCCLPFVPVFGEGIYGLM